MGLLQALMWNFAKVRLQLYWTVENLYNSIARDLSRYEVPLGGVRVLALVDSVVPGRGLHCARADRVHTHLPPSILLCALVTYFL